MTTAHINRICHGRAAPRCFTGPFVDFAETLLPPGTMRQPLFVACSRMSGIEHRFSFVQPVPSRRRAMARCRRHLRRRGSFPLHPARRMQAFEHFAPRLAQCHASTASPSPAERARPPSLTSSSPTCTGLYAPGPRLFDVVRIPRPQSVRRAHHDRLHGMLRPPINAPQNRQPTSSRSQPESRVPRRQPRALLRLHMQETEELETDSLLPCSSPDGCSRLSHLCRSARVSRSIASSSPSTSLRPATLITWKIRDGGFDMHLSGQVPTRTAPRHEKRPAGKCTRGRDPLSLRSLGPCTPAGRTIL